MSSPATAQDMYSSAKYLVYYCAIVILWHAWALTCLCPNVQSDPEASQESSSNTDSNGQQPLVRDADSVLSCLKRALKIANAAQQQLAVALKSSDTGPAFLYVEILNQYLYYFDQGLPNITSSVMQVRVELVRVVKHVHAYQQWADASASLMPQALQSWCCWHANPLKPVEHPAKTLYL